MYDLTGFDLANASLLDEATAAAEVDDNDPARVKIESQWFFVDQDTHPQTIDVIKTRAEALGIWVHVGDPFKDLVAEDVFGALVSYPGSSGEVRDFTRGTPVSRKALTVAATDLLA